jgi:hypothetical protein
MTDPNVDLVFALGEEILWQPDTSEVAALERHRLYMGGQRVLDDFTDDTEPTKTEVEALIRLAVGSLATRVGTCIPDRYQADARRVSALHAASLVEASYPSDDDALERRYTGMYLAEIDALTKAIRGGAGAGIGSLPVTTVVAESSGLLTDCDLLP